MDYREDDHNPETKKNPKTLLKIGSTKSMDSCTSSTRPRHTSRLSQQHPRSQYTPRTQNKKHLKNQKTPISTTKNRTTQHRIQQYHDPTKQLQPMKSWIRFRIG